MMSGKKIALVASVFLVFAAYGINKVIYGEDNRVDVFESTNSFYVELARSTAAMISTTSIFRSDDGYEIRGKTLVASGICAKERFSNQIAAANCSGFLVAPNKLVTAGHCVKTQADCDKYKWVFDYKVSESNDGSRSLFVDESSVVGCKRIIAQELNNWTKNDYAVLELERDVDDRRPLEFRTSGKIENNAPIVVIGHPTGIPTKIADGANVRDNSKDIYFNANLDTYGGNSGSAVFHAETGEVEGILVRGDTDYIRQGSCLVSNICPNNGCRGEDVTRITSVKGL